MTKTNRVSLTAQTITPLPVMDYLQKPEVFQATNSQAFPSVSSWRWFYRQHRDELLSAGAVVEIAGRLLVNAPKFAEAAMSIGRDVARARSDRYDADANE